MTSSLDLTELIERGSPFARTLGPTLQSLEDGVVRLGLDADVSLHNHVGGPHAATLFGLAETAAAGVVVSVFEDLVAAGAVPLIKAAEIDYLALATGPVTATASLSGDADGVRASYAARGVAVFPVEVVIADGQGHQTSRVVAQMALKDFGSR